MSEPVEVMVPQDVPHWMWLGALILVSAVTPTVIAWLNRRDSRAIRGQVQNDHDTNLREEMDDRHAQLLARLDELAAADRRTEEQFTQIRGCISNIDTSLGRINARTKRIGDEVRRDRDDLNTARADLHEAIRRADSVIAKHHPEERGLM